MRKAATAPCHSAAPTPRRYYRRDQLISHTEAERLPCDLGDNLVEPLRGPGHSSRLSVQERLWHSSTVLFTPWRLKNKSTLYSSLQYKMYKQNKLQQHSQHPAASRRARKQGNPEKPRAAGVKITKDGMMAQTP